MANRSGVVESGRRGWARLAIAVAVADLVLIAAGGALAADRMHPKASASRPVAAVPGATPHRTASARPSPRRTIILPPRIDYRVGQTATVVDHRSGAKLEITASGPRVWTTAIQSYGYGPARGYYLSFSMRIVNPGAVQVELVYADFLADVPGLSGVTVEDGNSPYSGAPNQLDGLAGLNPGQTLTGVLTFDVPGVHGDLRWVSGGQTQARWFY